MDERDFRLGLAGLGISTLALGLVQTGSLPAWVPWLIVAAGVGLIAFSISPFPVSGLMRRLALYLPFTPKKTVAREQNVTLAARLRWQDEVGRPLVNAPAGRVRNIWAALDIEVRNHALHPQRITDLYLEIRHSRVAKLKALVATADPVAVDSDLKWCDRQFPRRVEWELSPVSPPRAHFVRFDRGWKPDDDDAPHDPKTFTAVIVARLGTGSRPIRLQIGEDIWRTGEAPQ